MLSEREQLVREAEHLPDFMLRELLDFARFLKTRGARDRMEPAIASEPLLARDWLKPEEDAAWKNL